MYKIYGKHGCAFCKKAVEVLDSVDIPYQYLVLDEDYTREELIHMAGNGERLTYPRIFLDGELVGGYDELVDRLI